MKNQFRLAAIAGIFSLLLLNACVKEPIACFDPSSGHSTIDVGTTVSFTNCSFMASSFHWDFGDGATSTEFSPSHTYALPGFFTVTLQATNNKGTSTATVADVVTVGARAIHSVVVQSFPLTDTSGMTWDPSDAADLVFKTGPTGSMPTLVTAEATNATLPYTWNVSDIPFTNANWTWELYDRDGGTTDILISSGNFNPYGASSSNAITLTNGTTSIIINYELQ